jgi:hypothetical protein
VASAPPLATPSGNETMQTAASVQQDSDHSSFDLSTIPLLQRDDYPIPREREDPTPREREDPIPSIWVDPTPWEREDVIRSDWEDPIRSDRESSTKPRRQPDGLGDPDHPFSWNLWCRNPLFSPWTVYFWTVPILGGIGLCIYAAASGIVKRGFIINDRGPYNSTSNSTQPTFNITSNGGGLIIANFDSSNDILWAFFVFRTLPVVLSSFLALTWISNVDQSIRFSQPFANMYLQVAAAEDSILLDYLWGLPGLTTLKAANAGEYKVAWFSLLNLISPIFPILVGGLFTIVNSGKEIHFTITPETFYLVLALLVTYMISLPLAWPRRNRRLLRSHNCIADYASLFYASHLLHDPELDISARNATQRQLESRVLLEETIYTVGLYTGVDGRCHFGLDVASLDGQLRYTEHGRHPYSSHVRWPLDCTD